MENSNVNKLKNLKILIADDDESSRIYLSKVIKNIDSHAIMATTGYEVIESCRMNPDIDLILMDIKMPELNGYDVTKMIRKSNKDVVIIAQTCYALDEDKQMALSAGCNDHLTKPINPEELLSMIRKHVSID